MEYKDLSINVKICLELALAKKLALSKNKEYDGLSIGDIIKALRKRGIETTEEAVAEKIKGLEISATIIRKDEKVLELSSSAFSVYNGLVSRFFQI